MEILLKVNFTEKDVNINHVEGITQSKQQESGESPIINGTLDV